jgi:hypothetical protein
MWAGLSCPLEHKTGQWYGKDACLGDDTYQGALRDTGAASAAQDGPLPGCNLSSAMNSLHQSLLSQTRSDTGVWKRKRISTDWTQAARQSADGCQSAALQRSFGHNIKVEAATSPASASSHRRHSASARSNKKPPAQCSKVRHMQLRSHTCKSEPHNETMPAQPMHSDHNVKLMPCAISRHCRAHYIAG